MNRKYHNCFISFCLSFVIVTIIFALVGIIGGSYSMYEGDSYQQYLIFITDFIDSLKNGNSNWYSFSNYLGSGNILTIAYYCMSPFNIIFYIFPEKFFLTFFLVVSLKISLAAFLFCFFISEYTNENNYYYIIASLLYALSGYSISWYFNIMWLDSFYILPLLIAFVVRYVRKNTYICMILIYAYLFITNFYMGYIVGVCSAVFFVAYLFYYNDYSIKGNISLYIKKGLGFFSFVVLSAGLSAALLFPVAGFMTEHMAGDSVSFNTIVVNLFDIINSMFIGEFQTMDNKVPVLYGGISTLLLSIAFFFQKNINVKEKIFFGGILFFYIIGMLLLPLYKFLHAFDYPNYYGYRFSFVVVFLLITISCISLKNINSNNLKFYRWMVAILVMFYSFMMTFQSINYGGNRLNDQMGLVINALFIAVWVGSILYYLRKDKCVSRLFKGAMLTLAIIELIINGYICVKNTDFPHIEKALIDEWYYAIRDKSDEIKSNDDSFYRVYVNNDINMNSGKMFGFNGLNTFSSADSYELRMAVSRLGASTSNRYMRTNCNIPVFDSLFAVKYSINLPDYEDYVVGSFDSNNFIPANLSENEYPLSLGYMVKAGILDYALTDNSFTNIENLCNAMTGMESDFFEEFTFSESDIMVQNYDYNELNGRTYFSRQTELYKAESGIAYVMSDYKDNRYVEFSYEAPGSYLVFPRVYTDEQGAYHSKLVAEGGIYKMGDLDGYSYIKVATTDVPAQNFYLEKVYAAEYNEEAFVPVYDELASNQYEIKVNDIDFISGTVVATEDKPYLFTTIPYDPEWHIYVDGKPITKLYRVVGDAFMAIELAPGEHTVSFQYIEKWSNEGAIVSLISIIILCMIILADFFKKRRNTASNSDSNVLAVENIESANLCNGRSDNREDYE